MILLLVTMVASAMPALRATRADPNQTLRADQGFFRHTQPSASLQSLRGDSVSGGTVADSLPVVKGTLDVLVLKALSWGPMHGFEVTTWLEERSGGTLGIEDSALYQAFYRLEAREFIAAEWGLTENNRKARYYRITTAGRAHLRAQASQWIRYAETVSGILSAPAR